jgi:hypothetical protein
MLITGSVIAPGDVGCRCSLVVVGVRFMLQTLDSEICECYRHAAECNRSADQSRDCGTKQYQHGSWASPRSFQPRGPGARSL